MTLLCIKGNKKLELVKYRFYTVTSVTHQSKEQGYGVKLTIRKGNKTQSLYVPANMKNKMDAREEFNVNNGGDTTNKARMVLKEYIG